MSDAEATAQYLTGQMHPHHGPLLEAFQRESDAAVAAHRPALDLPYGPHPRQRFDLFVADGPWRGTLAWFHPGYWQARDKAQFRFLAPPFLARGIDVALVNYPLCPDVTLGALVEATRASVPAILTEAARRGRGGQVLVAAGHSAGGHIAAELGLSAWAAAGPQRPGPGSPGAAAPIAAVAAWSGVYDLSPLLGTPLNDKLRLDAGTARALSPLWRVRGGLPPALFAVGGAETQAFRDQSARMAAAWRAAGNAAELLEVPQADHFTLLRSEALIAATARLFDGSGRPD